VSSTTEAGFAVHVSRFRTRIQSGRGFRPDRVTLPAQKQDPRATIKDAVSVDPTGRRATAAVGVPNSRGTPVEY